MLCSLPAAKSSSSSSAWLDRLHSLKGFTTPSPPPPPPANPNPPSPPPPPAAPQAQQPHHALTAILSDLFVMPHSAPPPHSLSKRPFRKQPAPKICHLNSSSAFSPPPLTNTNKKPHAHTTKKINNPKARTDATVIDTSTPGWKSAKLLIRKGSIWKIRDKKQCNAGFTKRKRLTHASNKHKDLQKPSHPSDQAGNHEESIDVTQVPNKRPRLSKLPSVPEAAKSIALHLKVRTNVKKKVPSSSSSLN